MGKHRSKKLRVTQKQHQNRYDQDPRQFSIINWLRGIGAGSLLLGCAGITLFDFFLLSVVFVYLGFIVLAIDGFLERSLSPLWKTIIVTTICTLATAFTFKVSLSQAPIHVGAMSTAGFYKRGEIVGGVVWRPEFREIQLSIQNQSPKFDYDGLSALIKTDQPIVAINQITSLPNCYFRPAMNLVEKVTAHDYTHNITKSLSLPLVGTTGGYVVHCNSLPSGEAIAIELAVSNIDINQKNMFEKNLNYVMSDASDNLMSVRNVGGSRFWFGNTRANIYRRSLKPKWVSVRVSYRAQYRKRTVSKHIDLPGD